MIFGRCKLHTTRSAGPPKWYNLPGLSLGCWVATCLFDEGDILTPQVCDGDPSCVTLLHSCAEVRAAIELSFKIVSGVTPDIHVFEGGLRASSGKGEFWGHLPPLAQWFQCRVDRMWRYLVCQVFIMTKFA